MPPRKLMPFGILLVIVSLIAVGVIYSRNRASETLAPTAASSITTPSAVPSAPAASPTPAAPASPLPMPSSNPSPDLTAGEDGLSHATALLSTSQGLIKFKFYPREAPNTVKRIAELIQQGFYNGLTWHRVVPGFVAQAGDPQGTGAGGSGQKLKAEFNDRRHIEGALAMARGPEADSADSQFYIALGTFPHLDHSYTVFGQVVQGIEAARKLKVGDKIIWMVLE